jgi:coproporphyrinogen III oxidase-like Fe-S oxidoreductase
MNECKKAVLDVSTVRQREIATTLPEFKPLEKKLALRISRLLSTYVLTPFLQIMTSRYFRLQPVLLEALPGPQPGKEYTLYLHIPFCESVCTYCSFNRFLFDEDKATVYFRRLREEMRMAYRLGFRFTSLYIGGGTPTVLIDELCETIDMARSLFPIVDVSCETNPNHLIPEIIGKLEGRVQRLSVGVQSFDNDLLREMGRYHKFGSGVEIQEKIRQAAPHFPSLNVDMIYNFPNQTEEILARDIQMVIDSGAQQTTFYPLMTSPSVKKSLDQTVGKVDHGREACLYEIILEKLVGEFKPMSAWTFLRKGTGLIDEYIINSEEYVGLGSGAFSFLDGSLYVNTFSLNEYSRRIDLGHMSVSARQSYGKREQMRYRFMMELFGLNFDRKRFSNTFKIGAEWGLFFEMLFMLLSGSFAKIKHDAIYLTPRGKYLSVVMMREFFSGVNNVRDEARKALSEEERSCAFPVSVKSKQVATS